MENEYLLAADIGATKTDIGLFYVASGILKIAAKERFASCDGVEFVRRANAFLTAQTNLHRLSSVCFGVAGPVVSGRVEATNLGLVLDEEALQGEFCCTNLTLVNDLCATAASISILDEDRDIATLQVGTESVAVDSPTAILAPGTGLGMALLLSCDEFDILVSEGGHCDFAPRDESEIKLWEYLKKRFGRVSCERLLSGPGLVNIYDWFNQRRIAERQKSGCRLNYKKSSNNLPGVAAKMMDSAQVVAAAQAGDDLAVAALDCFISILGSVAGNLVLTGFAAGGLYLAGGIPLKIVDYLSRGHFLSAFTDKGRMSAWLKQVPVKVVLNPEAALLGAARIAQARISSGDIS